MTHSRVLSERPAVAEPRFINPLLDAGVAHYHEHHVRYFKLMCRVVCSVVKA